MRTCKLVLGAVGVLAFSATALAGPRPEGAVTPDGVREDTLTLVLPVQMPGVAVPVIELFLKD